MEGRKLEPYKRVGCGSSRGSSVLSGLSNHCLAMNGWMA